MPVTYDWGGNHQCVDLTGELSGRAGQIIAQWHDTDDFVVRADSFGAWLERFANELEQGRYVYVDRFGLTDDPPDPDDL